MVDTKQKIQVFQNEEFGELTTIIIDGNVWFIGREIAEILGYVNGRQAIISNVENEDKQVFTRKNAKFSKVN